ncbi:MAG: hypothetical protein IJV94_03110 [Bacilli bacterium]|nr:hypothetical protein [Bacilli bacterium]
MKSFLFEKYGYYPDVIENFSFSYKGYDFVLSPTDLDEEGAKELEYVSNRIFEIFNEGAILVKNRTGDLISYDGEQHYILWTTKIGKQDINKLMYLHKVFHNEFSNESILVDDLIELWEEKFEFIESKVIPSLRSDDHDYNLILEAVYFAFGLAENAIQYLADTKLDIGKEIIHNSLVHKRLSCYDNKVFFDPFNLIIDSPIRDYAELYKANQITIEEIVRILDYYELDLVEASVLMARVMYPTKLFDVLEKHYIDRKNIKKEILDYRITCEMELIRIKNLHRALLKRYNIRPLLWLEK